MKADKIIGAVQGVTKKWSDQRKREEKRASSIADRRYVMLRSYRTTQKEAAWAIMEQAYLKASADGSLPALARQIMYAARAYIQEKTGQPLRDKYFTQTLLPDYIMETGVDWNVVFDARGHFREPHTDIEVPLGTLEVREYLDRVDGHGVGERQVFDVREGSFPTFGPRNRYGAILFVEKEGFTPLFNAVRLSERFDVSIMSTKGLSVTASRELVDVLCSNHNIPLLVMHDFDKSGFSIVGTLKRATRRYAFQNKIEVIDLGLRLADIDGLESEEVFYGKTSPYAIKSNLRENGATAEEIEFLLKRRVELNALTSDQIVAWVEAKFAQHGVKKLMPDDETIAAAYRRASEQEAIQKMIDAAMEGFRANLTDVVVPEDLQERIAAKFVDEPWRPWDSILRDIVKGAA